MTTVFIDELLAMAGKHLGYGHWREIRQEEVNQFADLIEEHQWIHIDIERARARPFGGTVAQGSLILGLVPGLTVRLPHVADAAAAINYGLDRVRFPAPVIVGARVRAGTRIIDAHEAPGGVQIGRETTIEIEGKEKPACVARTLTRYLRAR